MTYKPLLAAALLAVAFSACDREAEQDFILPLNTLKPVLFEPDFQMPFYEESDQLIPLPQMDTDVTAHNEQTVYIVRAPHELRTGHPLHLDTLVENGVIIPLTGRHPRWGLTPSTIPETPPCSEPDCRTAIRSMREHLQGLAYATCEIVAGYLTCCRDGEIQTFLAILNPGVHCTTTNGSFNLMPE